MCTLNVVHTHASPSAQEQSGKQNFPGPEFIIRPRSIHFTGRDDILHRIHENFPSREDVDHETHPVVLHGASGIGKTEIALQYAHQFYTEYESVFWIDATNEETAIDSMLRCQEAILYHCRRPEITETHQCQGIMHTIGMNSQPSQDEQGRDLAEKSFLSWLTLRENPRWLLILDNLNPSQSVDLGWPWSILHAMDKPSRGNTIITTRDPDTAWNLHSE